MTKQPSLGGKAALQSSTQDSTPRRPAAADLVAAPLAAVAGSPATRCPAVAAWIGKIRRWSCTPEHCEPSFSGYALGTCATVCDTVAGALADISRSVGHIDIIIIDHLLRHTQSEVCSSRGSEGSTCIASSQHASLTVLPLVGDGDEGADVGGLLGGGAEPPDC